LKTEIYKKNIRSLTSLRFFAAACIVIGHGGSKKLFNYSIDLFDLRQAVSFFFVLSGFILSHAYPNLNWRTSFRGFLASRLARLWPAYIVTALLAIATNYPVNTIARLFRTAVNFLMLQSWIPINDWHYSVNAVSWSVSTEMFFYLVFPIALWLKNTRPMMLVFAALTCFCIMLGIAVAMNASPVEGGPSVTAWGLLYIFPLARLPEFLLGILAYKLAIWLHRNSHLWSSTKSNLLEAGALTIMAAAVVESSNLGKGILREIAPQLSVWVQTAGGCFGFALLIAVLYRERGVISRLLSTNVLVYLGKISFSLYLLHQIVIRWMFRNYQLEIESSREIAYIAYWIISTGGAALIYSLIEQPSRAKLRLALTKAQPSGLHHVASRL